MWGQLAGSCECGNEPLDYIKRGECRLAENRLPSGVRLLR
jgi:hypothetical protein